MGKAANKITVVAEGILSAVHVLANAKETDIKEIDGQIAKLKSEIDDFARPRKKQIQSLQSIRKILQMRFMPEKKRAKSGWRGAKPKGTELQQRIFDALAKSSAPSLSVQRIADLVDSKPGYVANAIRECDWFDSLNGQISIATAKK